MLARSKNDTQEISLLKKWGRRQILAEQHLGGQGCPYSV